MNNLDLKLTPGLGGLLPCLSYFSFGKWEEGGRQTHPGTHVIVLFE